MDRHDGARGLDTALLSHTSADRLQGALPLVACPRKQLQLVGGFMNYVSGLVFDMLQVLNFSTRFLELAALVY